MSFKSIISTLFFGLLLLANPVFAQNTTTTTNIDLKTVKVDELTDAQIQKLIEKTKTSGMTVEQLEAMALTRGMSQTELDKLKERINKLNLSTTSEFVGNQTAGNRTRKLVTNEDRITGTGEGEATTTTTEEDVFSSLTLSKQKFEEGLQKQIFGFDMFNNKNLTFEPSINVPTPIDYQIGPGDELVIDVWGASQQNYRQTVSPDGFIYIDNVGPIAVSGLNMDKASNRIISKLGSIYAGLSGSNPNTFAQVTLGNVRSIKVNIVGEVNLPGTYTLPSFSTAFNALYMAGGPSINGSYREIQIIRGDKVVTSLDAYDFLVKGQQKSNIRLQDQDVVRVSAYKNRIELMGEVKRAGIFETRENETMKDLISFAGGFNEKAYTYRINVTRNNSREHQMIDVTPDNFDKFILQNGDVVNVEQVLNRFENRVEITGAVYRPGFYALNDSLDLQQLLQKAEGLRGDAFLARANVYRVNDDLTIEVIPVDLTAVIKGTVNLALKREDLVKVSSIFDIQEDFFVQIDGEVKSPGKYPFVQNTTLEDFIVLAGGLLESATPSRIEVARRIKNATAESTSSKIADVFLFSIDKDLRLSDSASKFVLEPFDRVFIRRSPGYEIQTLAMVQGEVNFPGMYAIINKTERISDLVKRAGGLTPEAYIKGAKLIRTVVVDEKERLKLLKTLQKQATDSLQIDFTVDNLQTIGIDLERILENPESSLDLILQEGDILRIPKELQTVRMTGAFLYPITARYDKSYTFRDYVSQAGGFSDDAKPNKAYVMYANGNIKSTKRFLFFKKYPAIEPGAEIIVPRKPEREGLTAQETISLGTAMSSFALILVTIISKL